MLDKKWVAIVRSHVCERNLCGAKARRVGIKRQGSLGVVPHTRSTSVVHLGVQTSHRTSTHAFVVISQASENKRGGMFLLIFERERRFVSLTRTGARRRAVTRR